MVEFGGQEVTVDLIAGLKKERNRIAAKLAGIEAAISALAGTTGRTRKPMSAATKRKLKLGAKRRWARVKANKNKKEAA